MSLRRPPDIIIEQLLLDELPESFTEKQKQALLKDKYVQERLKSLKESNKRILADFPPDFMGQNIKLKYYESREAEQKQAKRRFNTLLIPVTTLSALAVVFLVLFLSPLGTALFNWQNQSGIFNPDQNSETINVKTNIELKIFRIKANGEENEKLDENQVVKENDILQIAYTTDQQRAYGMIFSIDGRGIVTMHYPEYKGGSIKLQFGSRVELPHSYQLDDAPRFERFFFVASAKQFAPADILNKAYALAQDPAASATKNLELGEGFIQKSILLLKENK